MLILSLVIPYVEVIQTACILEVQEMARTLPLTCRVDFKDPDHLIITPDDGLWAGGVYKFQMYNLDYNNEVNNFYYIDVYNLHYLGNKTIHFVNAYWIKQYLSDFM